MKQLRTFFALSLIICVVGCSNPQKTDSEAADSVGKTASQSTDKKTILVFGDSLTAGYGLDDPADAYPGVLQHYIDSLKLPYNVINSGVSGETTAGGRSRINWVLKQKPDIFLLELGANDGLRGTSVEESRTNLQAIIDSVKQKYPDAKIILLGMQVPPSMGEEYAQDFKKLYPELTAKNKVKLVPFLLAGVGGDPKLNQGDGIHPNVKGAKILAQNVWEVLQGEL